MRRVAGSGNGQCARFVLTAIIEDFVDYFNRKVIPLDSLDRMCSSGYYLIHNNTNT